MNTKSLGFKIKDVLYLVLAAVPIVFGIVLKMLTNPASSGISISGANIFFTLKLPIQDFPVSEAQVNSLLVIISIFWLCRYLTHGLDPRFMTKRQHFAELIVEKCKGLIKTNMGDYFKDFAPFIAAVLGLSGFSSLLSLFGMYPPTSDLNIVGGWAILVFVLITYYKSKCGPVNYVKSFGEPVAFLAPLNIISEVATPISMAFRHYGNILSGTVISVLIAAGLGGLSNIIFGWLPKFLSNIPILRIGIPAVLSIYFDVFSGLLQAFIFAMLTMLYVAGAFNEDEYFARKKRKAIKDKQ